MRLSYLQHVPFEGPGYIAEWATRNAHQVTGTRLDLNQRLPGVADFDMLVILGGPMSVNDEWRCPWLGQEKHLVTAAIAARKPILGVCLGAQLIASALGAKVYPASKEIGWFDVTRKSWFEEDAFTGSPNSFVPLHWHGETFDLPAGAVHLASSEACRNQAFQIGDRVLGLQFHLEANVDSVAALLEHARDDLVEGPFQQTPEQIRVLARTHCAANWLLLDKLLHYLEKKAKR